MASIHILWFFRIFEVCKWCLVFSVFFFRDVWWKRIKSTPQNKYPFVIVPRKDTLWTRQNRRITTLETQLRSMYFRSLRFFFLFRVFFFSPLKMGNDNDPIYEIFFKRVGWNQQLLLNIMVKIPRRNGLDGFTSSCEAESEAHARGAVMRIWWPSVYILGNHGSLAHMGNHKVDFYTVTSSLF